MGGLCVLLLMMFCVGWILCVFFLSMLIPLLIIYNGIVGVVCVILYFVLRKKVFSLNIQKAINIYCPLF